MEGTTMYDLDYWKDEVHSLHARIKELEEIINEFKSKMETIAYHGGYLSWDEVLEILEEIETKYTKR